VVRWLLGEPEAKEVEGEDGIGLGGIEQAAPVERARGKSVEQDEREPGPLTLEDVDAMPAEATLERMLTPEESRAWLEKLGVARAQKRWWPF